MAVPSAPQPSQVLPGEQGRDIVDAIRSDLVGLAEQLRASRAEAAEVAGQTAHEDLSASSADGTVQLLQVYLDELVSVSRASNRAEIEAAIVEATRRVEQAQAEADELLTSALIDVGNVVLNQPWGLARPTVARPSRNGTPAPDRHRPPTPPAFEIVDFDPSVAVRRSRPCGPDDFEPPDRLAEPRARDGQGTGNPYERPELRSLPVPRPEQEVQPPVTRRARLPDHRPSGPPSPGLTEGHGAPALRGWEPGSVRARPPVRPAAPGPAELRRTSGPGPRRTTGPPAAADLLQRIIPIEALMPMIAVVIMLIIVVAWIG